MGRGRGKGKNRLLSLLVKIKPVVRKKRSRCIGKEEGHKNHLRMKLRNKKKS